MSTTLEEVFWGPSLKNFLCFSFSLPSYLFSLPTLSVISVKTFVPSWERNFRPVVRSSFTPLSFRVQFFGVQEWRSTLNFGSHIRLHIGSTVFHSNQSETFTGCGSFSFRVVFAPKRRLFFINGLTTPRLFITEV